MPKNQPTAAKRARAAARAGAKYTEALREHERQARAGLADPTGREVETAVRALIERLRARRADADDPNCRVPWRFTQRLDWAISDAEGLAARMTGGELVEQVHVDRAHRAAELAQEAAQCTVNGLSFAMAGDVAAAYEVVRITRAALQGTCLLGQGRGTPCAEDPVRVRLRVHDLYGHHDLDASCIQHAAEEWTHWDHGGEVEIEVIGASEASVRVVHLGSSLRTTRDRG